MLRSGIIHILLLYRAEESGKILASQHLTSKAGIGKAQSSVLKRISLRVSSIWYMTMCSFNTPTFLEVVKFFPWLLASAHVALSHGNIGLSTHMYWCLMGSKPIIRWVLIQVFEDDELFYAFSFSIIRWGLTTYVLWNPSVALCHRPSKSGSEHMDN